MHSYIKNLLILTPFFNALVLGMEPPQCDYRFNEEVRNRLSQELLSELIKEHGSVLPRPEESVLDTRPGETADDKNFRTYWGLFVDENNCIKRNISEDTIQLAYMVLRHAVSTNDPRFVKLVLAIPSINVNARTEFNSHLLYDAAENGFDQVVGILLRVPDIDVNVQLEKRLSRTPLHCAAEKGHAAVVGLLLSAPVKVNTRDPWGCTALYCASEHNHHKIVRMLLAKNDIDANLPNQSGETPLHCAASAGQVDAVRELLASQKVNINAESRPIRLWEHTYGKWTPLDNTLFKDKSSPAHQEIARMLINAGATVNAENMQSFGKGTLARDYVRSGVHSAMLSRYDIPALFDGQTPTARLVAGEMSDIDSFIRQIPGQELPDMLICAAATGRALIFNKLLTFMGTTVDKKLLLTALVSAIRGGHVSLVTSLLSTLSREQELLTATIKEQNLQLMLDRIINAERLDAQQRADYEQIRALLVGDKQQEEARSPQPDVYQLLPANLIPQFRAFEQAWRVRVGDKC